MKTKKNFMANNQLWIIVLKYSSYLHSLLINFWKFDIPEGPLQKFAVLIKELLLNTKTSDGNNVVNGF